MGILVVVVIVILAIIFIVRMRNGNKETRLWDRANKFLLHDDYDTAIKISNECISLFPNCVEAYRVRGMAYKGKKDYDQAIADMNHVIELEPNNAYRYYGRSIIYSDMGDYEKEISDLTHSLKLDPSHVASRAAKEKLVIAQAKLGGN